MTQSLLFKRSGGPGRAASPLRELGAYEWLWSRHNQSFKKLAELFRAHADALPSDLADAAEADQIGRTVVNILREKAGRFGVRLHRTCDYPERLRDAIHPVELLYYQGTWEVVHAPSIAIVGTREPSDEGREDASTLAAKLVRAGWTVVSGLAKGIDTAAHTAALKAGGITIGVIGTPLSEAYPRANAELQRRIGESFLLISQVPVYRYSKQIWKQNRLFFPERNITMSALSAATVIIEASDTSGTLIQARAAIQQRRRLFILDRCFRDPGVTWPARYLEQGGDFVHRVTDLDEVASIMADDASRNR